MEMQAESKIGKTSICRMAISVELLRSWSQRSAVYETPSARRTWLDTYGGRLWTLPEALLCPSNHGVCFYSVTQQGFDVEQIEKRNLAESVCDNAQSARNLLEHYESSTVLSQLDFISVALAMLAKDSTASQILGWSKRHCWKKQWAIELVSASSNCEDFMSSRHEVASSFTIVDTWLMIAHAFRDSMRSSPVALPGRHRGVSEALLLERQD